VEIAKLSADLADKFWKKHAPAESDTYSWDAFVKDFSKAFCLDPIFANHQKYREAVKAALDVDTVAEKNASGELQKRLVRKANWDRFTKWFTLTNGPDLVAGVYALLTQPYFFGVTDLEEAKKKLIGQPEGTYLVLYHEKDWFLWYVEKSPSDLKSKKLEIVGSVELTVAKVLSDKSIFKSKIKCQTCSRSSGKIRHRYPYSTPVWWGLFLRRPGFLREQN